MQALWKLSSTKENALSLASLNTVIDPASTASATSAAAVNSSVSASVTSRSVRQRSSRRSVVWRSPSSAQLHSPRSRSGVFAPLDRSPSQLLFDRSKRDFSLGGEGEQKEQQKGEEPSSFREGGAVYRRLTEKEQREAELLKCGAVGLLIRALSLLRSRARGVRACCFALSNIIVFESGADHLLKGSSSLLSLEDANGFGDGENGGKGETMEETAAKSERLPKETPKKETNEDDDNETKNASSSKRRQRPARLQTITEQTDGKSSLGKRRRIQNKRAKEKRRMEMKKRQVLVTRQIEGNK